MAEQGSAAEYSPGNWAHQALLLLDEADALVRWSAASMPDAQRYEKAASAFWGVVRMLAEERERLEKEARTRRAGESTPC